MLLVRPIASPLADVSNNPTLNELVKLDVVAPASISFYSLTGNKQTREGDILHSG